MRHRTCQRGSIIAVVAVVLLLTVPALAQEPEPEAPPPEPSMGVEAPVEASPVVEEETAIEAEEQAPAVKPRWAPPDPDPKGDDWIRLVSGEWLKGELTRMRDKKLEFDSDELDDLKIDMSDIAYFRFTRPHTYRFRGREIARGTALMRDGEIKVLRDTGEVVTRDRDLLVTISRGTGAELDLWSVDVGVGILIREGNTKQTDFSGSAEIRRDTSFTRWSVDYSGIWSKVSGDKKANNHRLYTGFDYFLTWRLYLIVPFFEFFTDEFQNIDGRYSPGVGLGYEIIDNSWLEWDVSSGVGYQRTVFDSGSSDSDDAALHFGTVANFEVTSDLDFDNTYRLQLIPTDLNKTNHHLESKLSFDVWGPIDFDVDFVWDRIESPESDSDGDTPKSDDFRTTIGLAIDF